MNLTKKRWIYLVLCCLINLYLGSIYAWSVFATPMAEHLTQFAHHTLTTGDRLYDCQCSRTNHNDQWWVL